MSTVLIAIIAGILLLVPLIAIHEFGHYAVARLFGVKVITYAIGFGKPIWKWQSPKTGIVYQISAIPLGGYVRMLDEREFEEGDVKPSEQELVKAFNRQSVWKRFLIVFAGPAINLIFAVLLFWILYLPAQEQLNTRIGKVLANTPASMMNVQVGDKIIAVDGRPTDTWEKVNLALVNRVGETGHIAIDIERQQQTQTIQLPIEQYLKDQRQSALESIGVLPYRPQIKPTVSTLVDGGSAQLQGMKVGDEIIRIDGNPVQDWYDVVTIVRNSPEKLLHIDVLRAGDVVSLKIMPQAKYQDGQRYGSIGVGHQAEKITVPEEYKQLIQYSPSEALTRAVEKTYQLSTMIVGSIVKMIKGWIGLDNLSGPITVAKMAGQTVEMGWQTFFGFMAMMSVSLGILNLLPIPMLDGGHLMYYIVEMIRGKAVSEQIQLLGFKIGMIVLGSMMLLALFNDLMRL